MRRFNVQDPGFEAAFAAFLDERRGFPVEVDAAVADIVDAVRLEGVAAVLRFAERFDKIKLDVDGLRVTREDIARGAAEADPQVREAIDFAAARIRAYHERQRPFDHRFIDEAGAELGWRWTPLDSVGIYVPGGRGAYPSTVLVTAVPACVALGPGPHAPHARKE